MASELTAAVLEELKHVEHLLRKMEDRPKLGRPKKLHVEIGMTVSDCVCDERGGLFNTGDVDLAVVLCKLYNHAPALIAAAKATTSAEQRAVEARAELEQLAQSPDGRRQIDMLAAERVMVWVRRTRADVYQERTDDPEVPDGEWYAALGNEWWARDGDKWKDVAYVEDEGCCREDYEQGWRPTTSIADAWQLVEKMRADDYDVQVTARRWTTTCYIEQYESIKAVITNDTAPLAITIAAIIAGGEAT